LLGEDASTPAWVCDFVTLYWTGAERATVASSREYGVESQFLDSYSFLDQPSKLELPEEGHAP
jgi:hypothetical protein